ncbi:unnamed protein product [Pleuronectes platessa]|uniref:Uncharacterized protein n=1 Tax=Pleuronectes platessa TaxID=8262 RepID=A0A9N7YC02_PLEPL|nr:unnamed protein product [Pleuronectes platessa]
MKRRCEGDGVGFGGTEEELSGETGRRKSDKVHVDERSDGGREKGKGRRKGSATLLWGLRQELSLIVCNKELTPSGTIAVLRMGSFGRP